ncbi:hypothetical protein BU26DRAFT_296814 [Trematosphaeria pertusa]|uniref:Uncharacterized protein n=1 Tax=Trematosphaeria pertusa TaxID=390896 RepID=A0A6A6IJ08_9PLEO|nr:uncharacterized protein BU26DRAFT_296814 [Trematosphaeria pertusa]KAF2250167.1 hypothetical protein BU26DRAFT_296814 [Trematosphaeria pertusa]
MAESELQRLLRDLSDKLARDPLNYFDHELELYEAHPNARAALREIDPVPGTGESRLRRFDEVDVREKLGQFEERCKNMSDEEERTAERDLYEQSSDLPALRHYLRVKLMKTDPPDTEQLRHFVQIEERERLAREREPTPPKPSPAPTSNPAPEVAHEIQQRQKYDELLERHRQKYKTEPQERTGLRHRIERMINEAITKEYVRPMLESFQAQEQFYYTVDVQEAKLNMDCIVGWIVEYKNTLGKRVGIRKRIEPLGAIDDFFTSIIEVFDSVDFLYATGREAETYRQDYPEYDLETREQLREYISVIGQRAGDLDNRSLRNAVQSLLDSFTEAEINELIELYKNDVCKRLEIREQIGLLVSPANEGDTLEKLDRVDRDWADGAEDVPKMYREDMDNRQALRDYITSLLERYSDFDHPEQRLRPRLLLCMQAFDKVDLEASPLYPFSKRPVREQQQLRVMLQNIAANWYLLAAVEAFRLAHFVPIQVVPEAARVLDPTDLRNWRWGLLKALERLSESSLSQCEEAIKLINEGIEYRRTVDREAGAENEDNYYLQLADVGYAQNALDRMNGGGKGKGKQKERSPIRSPSRGDRRDDDDKDDGRGDDGKGGGRIGKASGPHKGQSKATSKKDPTPPPPPERTPPRSSPRQTRSSSRRSNRGHDDPHLPQPSTGKTPPRSPPRRSKSSSQKSDGKGDDGKDGGAVGQSPELDPNDPDYDLYKDPTPPPLPRRSPRRSPRSRSKSSSGGLDPNDPDYDLYKDPTPPPAPERSPRRSPPGQSTSSPNAGPPSTEKSASPSKTPSSTSSSRKRKRKDWADRAFKPNPPPSKKSKPTPPSTSTRSNSSISTLSSARTIPTPSSYRSRRKASTSTLSSARTISTPSSTRIRSSTSGTTRSADSFWSWISPPSRNDRASDGDYVPEEESLSDVDASPSELTLVRGVRRVPTRAWPGVPSEILEEEEDEDEDEEEGQDEDDEEGEEEMQDATTSEDDAEMHQGEGGNQEPADTDEELPDASALDPDPAQDLSEASNSDEDLADAADDLSETQLSDPSDEEYDEEYVVYPDEAVRDPVRQWRSDYADSASSEHMVDHDEEIGDAALESGDEGAEADEEGLDREELGDAEELDGGEEEERPGSEGVGGEETRRMQGRVSYDDFGCIFEEEEDEEDEKEEEEGVEEEQEEKEAEVEEEEEEYEPPEHFEAPSPGSSAAGSAPSRGSGSTRHIRLGPGESLIITADRE